MTIVFGSAEAMAVLRRANNEIGDYVDPPDEKHRQAVAARIWDMLVDTYIDNLSENEAGAIIIEHKWRADMVCGIQGILREEFPNGRTHADH